jgi:ABC-2 type transport system ATP-binding protein
MLQLTNVTKAYGPRIVLDIRNLTIPQGTHWVQGGNGSGKTTLMRILAGINPFEGSVALNSIDLKKEPLAYRKKVSFAEAEPLYPGFLTGQNLVEFVQKIRNETNKGIQDLTNHFDISHFLPYKIGTYSSGMTKKLSILLALIGQTNLVLLDEPLITLESSFLPQLLNILYKRQAKGTSFLISSHQAFPDNFSVPTGKIIVKDQSAQLSNT